VTSNAPNIPNLSHQIKPDQTLLNQSSRAGDKGVSERAKAWV
jgi:hypothetical protein